MINRLTRTITLVIVLLGLSACGNGNRDVATMLRAIPQAFVKQDEGPTGVSAEQINRLLSASDAPANLFVWEDRETQFLMVEIEKNQGHQTFGNSSRQTILFKDGVITGSRGLGGDLMSSDAEALIAQVRSRQSGTVPYVMRFLTPEDVTLTVSMNCAVTALGQMVPVAAGGVAGTGEAINAVCTAETGRSITNTFVVDQRGRILTTRQWMSDAIGHMTVQPLRL